MKYNVNGTLAKYKAHLVTRGFSQVVGVDYMETFSRVVWMTSMRSMIALAALYDLHIH